MAGWEERTRKAAKEEEKGWRRESAEESREEEWRVEGRKRRKVWRDTEAESKY